jgi:hypothetical protein
MFDRIVETSEALRQAMQLSRGTLIPALCGCKACGTVQMIAAPVLGICADCRAELTLLSREVVPEAAAPELGTAA